MFPVIRVNSRLAVTLEPLGTKRKFWFPDGERWMLFKAEERGTGEDWAERIACEMCALIGLPHVHYELAVESDGDRPRVVCESCAPPPLAFVLGNQLMLALDPEYPALDARKFKVKAHTVDAVAEALALLKPLPSPWSATMPEGIKTALDVFAGYVMLDAWVANQDRHHENWGILIGGEALRLAPTFDHGASMARNLSDAERHERLTTKDKGRQIGPFVRRARSAFYADAAATRAMTTVEAWRGFAAKAPAAAALWLARLAAIGHATIQGLLAEVPPNRMSHVCREFTLSLLAENQRRLIANEDE